jgi:hypothetical protein
MADGYVDHPPPVHPRDHNRALRPGDLIGVFINREYRG